MCKACEVFSCDTMIAMGDCTRSGNVIFAKNSDRPLLEAQPLVMYEAGDHQPGEMVQCTYISIPQAEHTYKVLGSKPFWIWGFEHGMNEHNVAIGNEAVWSVEKEEAENGLLGMDLLRLGLERGKTAYEAMHVITSLLETYGQGGNAALYMEHRYHNAFIIADPEEAWVLDTVNRRWVARKIKGVLGISNCYSTEESWDEGSEDIIQHAIECGYADPNEEKAFNFARVYGVMGLKQRAAWPRYRRLNKLLQEKCGQIDVETMQHIMRDHFEGEIIEPRFSPADGLEVSICMHNIDENSSVTAAGAIVELTKEKRPVFRSGMSRSCMAVFIPYSIDAELPESVSYADGFFEENSLWWKMERLTMETEMDYPRNIEVWRPERDRLQKKMDQIDQPDAEIVKACAAEVEAAAESIFEKLKQMNQTTSQKQRKKLVAKIKKAAKA